MLRTDPLFQAPEQCVKLYWSLAGKGRRCSSGTHSLLDIAFFFGGLSPFRPAPWDGRDVIDKRVKFGFTLCCPFGVAEYFA